MRCILIDNPGPHSRLIMQQQPIPECKAEEILVQVKATALNRADLLQRQGKYSPPPQASKIPGLELAGIVVAKGSQVQHFNIGDRVYGLVAGGAYAQYCCIHQHLAAQMPATWAFTYAAALPEAMTTAHATVCLIGKLKKSQTILIHAAGSGISTIAIQMALLKGAHVISTTSNAAKIAQAQKLWSIHLINYKLEDFAAVIGENNVDVVLDYIGADYFIKHLNLLKVCGKLIQISCMQSYKAEINLLLLMQKRLQINGFILRSQPVTEKILLWRSMQKKWGDALLHKHIAPIIDSEFSLTEIEQAHAHMKSNEHFGKIVIRVA